MEPALIIAGAAGLAGLGVGLGTAVRLIPVYVGARGEFRDFKNRAAVYDNIEVLERERRSLGSPPGHKRDSSIVGIYESALRHADGSYTMGYSMELATTVFGDDHVIEARTDAIARLLAVRKPPGTFFSFGSPLELIQVEQYCVTLRRETKEGPTRRRRCFIAWVCSTTRKRR